MVTSLMVHWYQCTKMQGCLDASSRVVPRCVGTFHLERCSYASLACDTGSNLLSECAAYARLPAVHGEGRARLGPGLEPRILSGSEERGSAFITTRSQRGNRHMDRHRLPANRGRVSYARLVQDSNIGIVDVSCTEPASVEPSSPCDTRSLQSVRQENPLSPVFLPISTTQR